MTIQKEELNAGVSLAMTVVEADGVLEKGQPVVITDTYEVTSNITGLAPAIALAIGYVLVPNREAAGTATIFFRARAVKTYTSYEAFVAGALLAFKDDNEKISQARIVLASGTITVVDFTWDGGETLTVDDVVLTEGTDFTAGTSNEATALAIADAINQQVSTVRATVNGADVVVTALAIGEYSIPLATDDDGADVTVSGSTLEGADVSALYPYGVALEEATGADEEIDVLVF